MRAVLLLTLPLSVLSLAGCGGGAEGRQPVFPVTGTITMSGKPVAGASVTFSPQDGKGQPMARGKTSSDGSFVMTTYEYGDGAAKGKYAVMVSKVVVSDALEDPEGHDPEATEDIDRGQHGGESKSGVEKSELNPKYSNNSTPLNVEVKSSGNDFPLVLDP